MEENINFKFFFFFALINFKWIPIGIFKIQNQFQNSWIQTFILQCMSLMCLKLWDIRWIMFKKLKIHWINAMWFQFIILWTFQNPENYNYFRSLLSIKKKLLLWFFYMSYHHDLKLENETKCYFQYNQNIHILS